MSDPVAGTVTVTVQEMRCTDAALWRPHNEACSGTDLIMIKEPVNDIYHDVTNEKRWDRYRRRRHYWVHCTLFSISAALTSIWKNMLSMRRTKCPEDEESSNPKQHKALQRSRMQSRLYARFYRSHSTVRTDRGTIPRTYQKIQIELQTGPAALLTSSTFNKRASFELVMPQPRALYRQWMMVALRCNLQIARPLSDWLEGDGMSSATVDLSMQVPSPRSCMTGNQFVWFALCCGISPAAISWLTAGAILRPLWSHKPFGLKLSAINRGWRVTLEGSYDGIDYSLRRGFAFAQIMRLDSDEVIDKGTTQVHRPGSATRELKSPATDRTEHILFVRANPNWCTHHGWRPPHLARMVPIDHIRLDEIPDLDRLAYFVRHGRMRTQPPFYRDQPRPSDMYTRKRSQDVAHAFAWALYYYLYKSDFKLRWSIELVHCELVVLQRRSLYLVYLANECGRLTQVLQEVIADEVLVSELHSDIEEHIRLSEEVRNAIRMHKLLVELKAKLSHLKGLKDAARRANLATSELDSLKSILLQLCNWPDSWGCVTHFDKSHRLHDRKFSESREILYEKFVESEKGRLLIQSFGPKCTLSPPKIPLEIDFLDTRNTLAVAANVLVAMTPWSGYVRSTWIRRGQLPYRLEAVVDAATRQLASLMVLYPGLPQMPIEIELEEEVMKVLEACKDMPGESEEIGSDEWLQVLNTSAEEALEALKDGIFQVSHDDAENEVQKLLERFDESTIFEFV